MAAGVHLRAIQQEMGHDSPKTTAVYTQLPKVGPTKEPNRRRKMPTA